MTAWTIAMERLGWIAATMLAALALSGAAPHPAEAAEGTRRALLVGVSDYPRESVGDLQLAGPKNDVALMLDTIAGLGFADADVTVLADSLDRTWVRRRADGPPTKAAITAALADLAARARPGDTVLLYFSGHGSRQPDLDPAARAVPTPDGLEEIFLPIDIGPWDYFVGSVANALVDHELGRAVAAIRATGARAWVVIDACHSGTMTRSGDDARPKQVPPAVLRIPESALAAARARATAMPQPTTATRGAAGGARPRGHGWFDASAKPTPPPAAAGGAPAVAPGEYVAFFAAHPDEVALQKALPRGYGVGERRPHGVLTFHLAEALRSGRVATHRDVAHRVMAGYEQFGRAPTPMFEGDLSSPVPGAATRGPIRWPVSVAADGLRVAAGVVDGLEVGAVVALAPVDAPEAPRGFARVEAAGAASARLAPIARDGRAPPADLGAAPLVASLVERGADFVLRVAAPSGDDPASRRVAAALPLLAGERIGAVTPVGADEPADLRLRVSAGRIWLIGDDVAVAETGREAPPSIPLPAATEPEAIAEALRPPLATLAKARNLVRLAGVIGPSGLADRVSVESFVVADDGVAGPTALAADDRPCPAAPRDRLPASAVPLGLQPELRHCDTVWFRLTNRGDRPVDVTPLYVDGGGGVTHLAPPDGAGLRLDPGGAPRLVATRIVTWSRDRRAPLPIGRERLLFVMVEVEGRAALPADFRHLAQPSLPRGATRAIGPASPLAAVLEAAAFGPATRGVTAPTGTGRAAIVDFPWRVVAPDDGR